MSEIFRRSQDGFNLIGLRSELVELSVAPQLGGKIVSLVDRRAEREWMWHPQAAEKLFANIRGDPFDRSTMTGADECVPSVAQCIVNGRSIPDHGEVWSMPWQLDQAKLKANEIALSVSLPISPLDFSRTITLNDNVVDFRYRLHNRSNEPQHYLWAFHPLMRIETGDRIELPPEIGELRVESTSWPDIQRGKSWHWPSADNEIDLSRMQLGSSPAYAKCFVDAKTGGQFSLLNPSRGQRISFEFDSPHITAVGVWLTRGGWNGYHHVALEPTNAAADSLEQAMGEKLCKPIPAGESIEWSFRIVVGN